MMMFVEKYAGKYFKRTELIYPFSWQIFPAKHDIVHGIWPKIFV